MPGTYYGPYNTQYETFAEPAGGNTGTRPLGHYLILPDGRKYRYSLNDATAELAGNLYQSALAVADHRNQACDVARAINAVVISSTIGATAAAEDIYNEGIVHTNDVTGEGYAYRIKRARANAQGHASVAASVVLSVNLEAGERVQVALTTSSEVTFSRNRFRQMLIHASPATARLTGVSPGVAAADRYYWSQVSGEAAVLGDGTLLQGLPVQASITIDGAVESHKRRITTGGTSVASPNYGVLDQDGASVAIGIAGGATATTYDITGGISINAPLVGNCIQVNASTEYGLIELLYLGS